MNRRHLLRLAIALISCFVVSACSTQESELSKLYQQGKFEEFVAKVQEIDPRRENRAYDMRMSVAIPKARLARCLRERDSLLTTLTDLERKGAYEEISRIVAPCRDADPKFAAFQDKAKHELDYAVPLV